MRAFVRRMNIEIRLSQCSFLHYQVVYALSYTISDVLACGNAEVSLECDLCFLYWLQAKGTSILNVGFFLGRIAAF